MAKAYGHMANVLGGPQGYCPLTSVFSVLAAANVKTALCNI